MDNLTRWAKPDALLIFAEPVTLNKAFRKLRFMLPIEVNGTPEERPLEEPELSIIRAHLTNTQVRRFSFLGRLNRFVLRDGNYENASFPLRKLADLFWLTDYLLLSLPFLKKLAGVMVIYGRPNK